MTLTRALPSEPAGMLQVRLGRKVAAALIALLVAGIAAAGGLLLASVPAARAAVAAYNAATPYRCGEATPPPGVECWAGIDGRLVGLRIGHSQLGARQVFADVAMAGGTTTLLVEQSQAVVCAVPGEAVTVRLWQGAVTSVFTPQGVMPTAANPNVDADVAFQGGVALLAIALLIPAGLVLAWLRHRRRGEVTTVSRVFRSRVMRWAVLAFLLGQAADVATSAIGQSTGLAEGNALVDVFVRATGPGGFLLFRLPAVVLVLLGLSQVPRRIAVTALVGLGAVFLAVGVHNALLVAGVGSGVSCGAPVALP